MFHYKFPKIQWIDDVRKIVDGRPEFIEADRDTHIIFNYLVNFEDTFPPVFYRNEKLAGPKLLEDQEAAILRECRGMIFDKKTGHIIARRYHKFFNFGEKPETHAADFKKPYRMFEKLDGSMITPFRTSDGVLRIGTKMGETDVAEQVKPFINSRPDYLEFIHKMIDRNQTPIFEWCSRKQRIVVDYPEDRLVLTAVRDNISGDYLSYDKMIVASVLYGIDLIQDMKINFKKAQQSLDVLQDMEGYVVRFDDGHMLKLKGEWYCLLHKTLDNISREKDIIRLIVTDTLDDAKSFLPPDLVEKLDKFGSDVFRNVNSTAVNLAWGFIENYDRYGKSKKNFALAVKDKKYSSHMFKIFDAYEKDEKLEKTVDNLVQFIYNMLIEQIKLSTGTQQKVDSVRYLFGDIKWEV